MIKLDILVKLHTTFEIKEMMTNLLTNLRKEDVRIICASITERAFSTEHFSVKFVSESQGPLAIKGRRADVVYGFTEAEMAYLGRPNNPLESQKINLFDYICEKEKRND